MLFPNKGSSAIKNWAVDDRPREKMLSKGVMALSNSELLAILITKGSKEKSALEIAQEIMHLGNDNLNELGKLSIAELQRVKGIGAVKAIAIVAAMELGRRRHSSEHLERKSGSNSREIAEYLKTVLKDYRHEVFAVIFLSRSNKS